MNDLGIHFSPTPTNSRIHNETWFKDTYAVDEVHFHESGKGIAESLSPLKPKRLLLLRAFNTDSEQWLEPANFPGIEAFQLDTTSLYPVMAELRVLKTDAELEVMRYASKIAAAAHMEVMKKIHANMYEYQMESLFRHISYYTGGCRHLSYTCIAASGENAAVLHYGHANAPNAKLINDGDICVFDMGPEYNCYGMWEGWGKGVGGRGRVRGFKNSKIRKSQISKATHPFHSPTPHFSLRRHLLLPGQRQVHPTATNHLQRRAQSQPGRLQSGQAWRPLDRHAHPVRAGDPH